MPQSQLAVSFECTPLREITPADTEQYPSEALIDAIADLEGVDRLDLPPLYDAIDPDLVDRVPATEGTDSTVALCFTYHGWNVFVRGDGSIVIGDPDEQGKPTPLF